MSTERSSFLRNSMREERSAICCSFRIRAIGSFAHEIGEIDGHHGASAHYFGPAPRLQTRCHRSSHAFKGSGPTTAPLLVKLVTRSAAGSYRGQVGRPPPLGSPARPNATQYALASVAQDVTSRADTEAAARLDGQQVV